MKNLLWLPDVDITHGYHSMPEPSLRMALLQRHNPSNPFSEHSQVSDHSKQPYARKIPILALHSTFRGRSDWTWLISYIGQRWTSRPSISADLIKIGWICFYFSCFLFEWYPIKLRLFCLNIVWTLFVDTLTRWSPILSIYNLWLLSNFQNRTRSSL